MIVEGATSTEHQDTLPLVVGVDLGGTQIRTAVLQGAKLLSRVSLLTGPNPIPDRIIPRMCEAIEEAIEAAHLTPDQVAGIGVGAPGPLNSRTGVVFAPPNLQGWKNVPLRDIFQAHFSIPIFVENDANVAALAEHMFGAGRHSKEMVYMTVSTGIGGGVISNGRILEGIVGTAAELGHMTIDWHGDRCNCGNIGCLESISSGTAIARRANEMIAMGQGEAFLNFVLTHEQERSGNPDLDQPRNENTAIHVTAHMVAQAAEAGIPEARAIIARAAEGLGVGLVNIIHSYNPEVIILGGSVTQIGSRLLDPALKVVKERAMVVPRESVRIVLAELGADVGLVGAGALIYYNNDQQSL
ncbi:MAG TPA: ROK family protein [Ktedonobacteraceae bacterium]|jgi:glucokinase|nr:ROK family protein [Ktedonobacteraceae bacterium]